MKIDKNNILPVVAIAVAGIMIGAGFIAMVNPDIGLFGDISLQGYSTSITNHYATPKYSYKDNFGNRIPVMGSDYRRDGDRNGFGDDEYVTSWYDRGRPDDEMASETITFSSSIKASSYGWGNIFGYTPCLLLGDYWYKITYIDTNGNSHIIVDKGYVNNEFVELGRGNTGEAKKFPGLDYRGTKYDDMERNYRDWWGAPKDTTGGSGKLEIRTIDAMPIEFRMVGGHRPGWLKAEMYVEYAELEDTSSFPTYSWDWHFFTNQLVQSQYARLRSGEGEIKLEKTNKVTLTEDAYADGTKEYYTKHTYEEGTSDGPTMVPIKIRTGASGPTAGEPGNENKWHLKVINNNNGKTVLDKYYGDQKTIEVDIPIPEGTFEKYGENTFDVELYNGLLKQSSTQLFVVDTYEKVPSDARVTTNGETFNVGDTVEVQCKAYSNPKTEEPITHFRVFARKGGYTTGTYAYGPKSIKASNTGEQEYSSSFSFTPDYRAYYYIQAVPYDAAGRYGGENEPTSVHVTSAPTYTVTIRVEDSSGQPVSGAEILIGNLFRKATFSSGEREFDIESGNYKITVMHSQYNTSEETYFINNDRTITVTLLEPDEEIGGGSGTTVDNGEKGQGEGDNPFAINIFNTDSDPVKEASVSLNIGYSGMTNRNGMVTFMLLDSEITDLEATIDATGYEIITVSIPKENVESQYYSMVIGDEGQQDESATYDVTVQVYETGTTEIVEWASVSTSEGETLQTDDSGMIDVQFTSKTGSITVSADGYNDKTEDWDLDTDGEYIDIGLTSIGNEDPSGDDNADTYTVSIEVGDTDTYNTLSGAMVTFNGITKTADSGTAIFSDVIGGFYAVRADMKGYETKEKSVSVDEYNTDFTILLTPSDNPEDSDNEAEEQTSKTKYDFSVVTTNGNEYTYVKLGDLEPAYGYECMFKISEGTYSLTVGSLGYETWNGEVTIPNETSKEITLTEETEEGKKTPIDIDGDGIRNSEDDDMDGDGIPNDEDADDDGDGIPDIYDEHPYVQDIQEVDLLSMFTDNLMYIVIAIIGVIIAFFAITIYKRRRGWKKT